jgi:hypothetical protein
VAGVLAGVFEGVTLPTAAVEAAAGVAGVDVPSSRSLPPGKLGCDVVLDLV